MSKYKRSKDTEGSCFHLEQFVCTMMRERRKRVMQIIGLKYITVHAGEGVKSVPSVKAKAEEKVNSCSGGTRGQEMMSAEGD